MDSGEALFRDFLRVERMIFLSSWLVEGVMGSSQSCRLPVLDPVALSHFGRVRNFISPVCRCYTHIPSPATSVHVAQPLHGGGAALSRRCGGEEPCWELHLVGQCCPWGMLLWDKSLFMLVLFLVMLASSCFLGRGPNGDHGQLVVPRVTKLCFGGRSPQALSWQWGGGGGHVVGVLLSPVFCFVWATFGAAWYCFGAEGRGPAHNKQHVTVKASALGRAEAAAGLIRWAAAPPGGGRALEWHWQRDFFFLFFFPPFSFEYKSPV